MWLVAVLLGWSTSEFEFFAVFDAFATTVRVSHLLELSLPLVLRASIPFIPAPGSVLASESDAIDCLVLCVCEQKAAVAVCNKICKLLQSLESEMFLLGPVVI